jgi:hypothetical protein
MPRTAPPISTTRPLDNSGSRSRDFPLFWGCYAPPPVRSGGNTMSAVAVPTFAPRRYRPALLTLSLAQLLGLLSFAAVSKMTAKCEQGYLLLEDGGYLLLKWRRALGLKRRAMLRRRRRHPRSIPTVAIGYVPLNAPLYTRPLPWFATSAFARTASPSAKPTRRRKRQGVVSCVRGRASLTTRHAPNPTSPQRAAWLRGSGRYRAVVTPAWWRLNYEFGAGFAPGGIASRGRRRLEG